MVGEVVGEVIVVAATMCQCISSESERKAPVRRGLSESDNETEQRLTRRQAD